MPPIVVATCFRIPHVGGASTHVEALVAGLRGRAIPTVLVSGRGGWSRLHPRRLVRHVLDRDAARAAVARETVDDVAARIGRRLGPPGPGLVVHAHDALAACAALRLRRPDVAVVQTVHGILSREVAGAMRGGSVRYRTAVEALEREAFDGVDLVIAVSRERAETFVREFGVDPARIDTIPNAVDVDALAAPPDGTALRDEVVVPRRLTPVAGVEVALHALRRMPPPRPRLVIAGDGPLRASLEALARRLGVAQEVEFLGNVQRGRLMERLRGAKAVVLPSVPAHGAVEGMPLAALEAMAVGVPVVASHLGGLAELVGDGHGWLVPPGDPSALAEALRAAISLRPAERASLAERARARVRRRHGVEAWLDRTLEAYERASRVRGGATSAGRLP